jgi:type IV pilus assembly protein PilE
MKTHGVTGFSLIELMIVVVVVAILAAVAYPGYQDHVRKAKRAEAKTALLKAAQVQERNYSDKSTYVTDLALLFGQAANAPVYSGENAADNTSPYTIAVVAPTAACPINACFLLTAAPNAPYTDAKCGNFTLTSTGARGWSTSGDPTTVSTCKW